jgi:hypothetical protein
MALYMDQFNQVTVAPGGNVYTAWTYEGAVDLGPSYVSASFVGGDDNFGTMTTVQTGVTAFETTQYGYYWPMGISYQSVLRNDSSGSVALTVNIGDFQ